MKSVAMPAAVIVALGLRLGGVVIPCPGVLPLLELGVPPGGVDELPVRRGHLRPRLLARPHPQDAVLADAAVVPVVHRALGHLRPIGVEADLLLILLLVLDVPKGVDAALELHPVLLDQRHRPLPLGDERPDLGPQSQRVIADDVRVHHEPQARAQPRALPVLAGREDRVDRDRRRPAPLLPLHVIPPLLQVRLLGFLPVARLRVHPPVQVFPAFGDRLVHLRVARGAARQAAATPRSTTMAVRRNVGTGAGD